MALSLNELKDQTPVHKRGSVSIDISEYYGAKEGTEFLVIAEPRLRDLADSQQDSRKLWIDNPEISADGAYHVLLLARNHRTPEGDREEAKAFYTQIASTNEPLFAYIRQKFYEGFPWLADLMVAAIDRKNE